MIRLNSQVSGSILRLPYLETLTLPCAPCKQCVIGSENFWKTNVRVYVHIGHPKALFLKLLVENYISISRNAHTEEWQIRTTNDGQHLSGGRLRKSTGSIVSNLISIWFCKKLLREIHFSRTEDIFNFVQSSILKFVLIFTWWHDEEKTFLNMALH